MSKEKLEKVGFDILNGSLEYFVEDSQLIYT